MYTLMRDNGMLQILASTLASAIQTDKPISSAVLQAVARTRPQTIAHGRNPRHIVLVHTIATETLVCVLHASILVAFGTAFLHALGRR